MTTRRKTSRKKAPTRRRKSSRASARHPSWFWLELDGGHKILVPAAEMPDRVSYGDVAMIYPASKKTQEMMDAGYDVDLTLNALHPNTIPPPPESGRAAWRTRTFAPGTRVRLVRSVDAYPSGGGRSRRLPAGTIGTVRTFDDFGGVQVGVEVDEPLFTSSTRTVYRFIVGQHDLWDGGWSIIEPIDDNWGPLVVPPQRGMSPSPQAGWARQLRASRQRRSSRRTLGYDPEPNRMKANPIPPQPSWTGKHLMSWIERTYTVGTPVMFTKGTPVPWSNEVIPPGARGVVVGHHFDLDANDYLNKALVLVEITDARHRDGGVISELVGRVTTVDALYFTVMDENILAWLTPLHDNWIAAAPIKRHALPRSQRRSSRRTLGYDPEPNARSEHRRSSNKEVNDLIQKARGQGWTVIGSSGSHWIFRPPDASKGQVVVSGSPSDRWAIKNAKGDLRRAGLKLNRRRVRRNPSMSTGMMIAIGAGVALGVVLLSRRPAPPVAYTPAGAPNPERIAEAIRGNREAEIARMMARNPSLTRADAEARYDRAVGAITSIAAAFTRPAASGIGSYYRS